MITTGFALKEFTSSPCYFAINPPTYDHHTVETPLATPLSSPGETSPNPLNPLLAYCAPQMPSMASANLLKLQTAAAHGQPIRPRPQPHQNVLQVTSDDSTTSSDSSSSSDSDSWSPPETARCSRCQRRPSTDIHTRKSNMVQYGLNLYYCSRCAAMVGMVNR